MARFKGGVGINVKTSGTDKVLAQVVNVNKRALNLSDAMQSAATIMELDILQHFTDKMSSDGTSWPAVSDLYAARKEEAGRNPNNILVYDGTLRRSISLGKRTDTHKAVVGTNVIYSAVHNFGLTIRGRGGVSIKMPKREFMWIGETAQERLRQVVLAYLATGR